MQLMETEDKVYLGYGEPDRTALVSSSSLNMPLHTASLEASTPHTFPCITLPLRRLSSLIKICDQTPSPVHQVINVFLFEA